MEAGKIIQVIRKIPLFRDLSSSQLKMLFSVCESMVYQPDEVVCRNGSNSTEMFILLAGELSVYTEDGFHVATITPVTTVGEIGVITGEPRSATVRATKAVRAFQIRKMQIDRLVREDAEMGRILCRNVIRILSEKLVNDNTRIRVYQLEKERYEGNMASYRKRVEDYQQQMIRVQRMIVESTSMSRQDVESALKQRIKASMKKILLVEEEEEVRDLLRDVLDQFDVLEVEDGQEAMKTLQSVKPDLVITDIIIPKIDGPTFLKNLKYRFPEVPVIVLSSEDMDEDQIAEKMFDCFLTKPIDLIRLREAVRELA